MKRIANLMDASLPAPPTAADFTLVIQNAHSGTTDVDPLLGEAAGPASPKRSGTNSTEKAGVACFLDYVAVCAAHSVTHDTLDSLFMGWARWVVDAKHLAESPDQVETLLAARKTKAGANFRVYAMPVLSFRTYCNALARMYQRYGPKDRSIVPSSVKQFPGFNGLMSGVITRFRGTKASNWKAQPENNTLQTAELVKVVATATATPLQVQRKNILCLAFATGYRGEIIRRLTVESL